jgi:LmbE family N-acetylglucosaminyl deacetylase
VKRLFIAAHADDEVIGAGGAMKCFAEQGDEVSVGILTSPADAGERKLRAAEAAAAWAVLGVADGDCADLRPRPLTGDATATDTVAGWIERWHPEIIYLPHRREVDPDHRQVEPIVRSALLHSGGHAMLVGYEVWTPLADYHLVQDITAVAAAKRSAIEAYRSQATRTWAEGALGLNRYRGTTTSKGTWCEVFQVVAW